jgi:hypothetical protein
MAQVTGRPTPVGASSLHAQVRGLDTQQHPLHNIGSRTARPINYSPLGPSTLHVAAPLKPQKLK